ncbi:FG-GAP-like repeat-containing protein [Jiangella endophytica]|uniref:FG-GAP-like repeat-containing protein n=1 Tax=Jiangella endophytica TaxID=1623398 RepID=UPI000E3462A4|nr:FG-GAP-like repeat-containing protein [Jiangella endophytica]
MHPRNVAARRRRALPALVALALGAAGLTALPAAGAGPAGEPAETAVQTIALDDLLAEAGPTVRADGPSVGTGPIETDPFDVAAVTWPAAEGATDVHLLVRARGAEAWTPWYELHDDGHAPDPGTPEAADARRGTDPVIVPGSEAIELRVEAPDGGELPEGLELTLIDPGTTAADAAAEPAEAAAAPAEAATTAGTRASAPKPVIYSRAAWGADESLREQTDPLYGDVQGGFVHHTAGTNTYTEAEVPAILRGIYEYHVVGRGWRDVGYNFFVDRFGRIWEGRWGGIDRSVVGAHVEGYNSYSVGVAALGEFTATQPGQPVVDAYARLFGWKFGLTGVDPQGSFAYPGQQTLPTIAGHRDGTATECPGELLYAQLGAIRDATDAVLNPPPVPDHDFDGDGNTDLIARENTGRLYFFPGEGGRTLAPPVPIGTATTWNRYTALAGGSDFDNDGRADMVARENTGRLYFVPGRGDGTFAPRVASGTSTTWNRYTTIVDAGDLNRSGRDDLVAVENTGKLYFIPGRGDGTFGVRVQIGTATTWGRYTALVGGNDFDNDGHPDLVARENSGRLYFFPGRTNGTYGPRTQIGTSTTWGRYTAMTGVGDLNNSGRADIVMVENTGRLYFLPGRGDGTFGTRIQIGTATTWGRYTAIV